MRIKSIHFVMLIPIFLLACVDEYWPNVDRYEQLMVVDGMITDEPGPYEVKLSLTAPANDPSYIPLSGCFVSIVDDLGNTEILKEFEPGTYRTDSNGIRGITGRQYKLIVHRDDERSYETAFETLPLATEIDSIYTEIEYKEDKDLHHELAGLQFYLDSKRAKQDTNYFMWRGEATYHYESDYTIRWYYDGSLEWFHGPDSLYHCWKTYPLNIFFLQSTLALNEPIIKRLPLHYVNTQTRLLSVRYSLLMRQFSLSQRAYAFWETLAEMNTQQGSLYTNQPYQTKGNLVNTTDLSEVVLGYFLVTAVAEKRIFVDRPNNLPFYYPTCSLDEADFEAYGALHWADPVFYPIYAIETNGGRRAVPNQSCVDCRRHGGTINKPDFWIDPW